ncbi:hypothetical protein [Ascidiimonas aurantiaca]|uniref:hypothetical protein n=1 Tax=Ascidiimonas aurantiaca TaxID=1685432 RepID=UPI0030EE27A5
MKKPSFKKLKLTTVKISNLKKAGLLGGGNYTDGCSTEWRCDTFAYTECQRICLKKDYSNTVY